MTLQGILMAATSWLDKGCAICRGQWESGTHPPELAVSNVLHSRLHCCNQCGTYWEQHERFADVIDEKEAVKLYPGAFPSCADAPESSWLAAPRKG
jgi:hypothetical protein